MVERRVGAATDEAADGVAEVSRTTDDSTAALSSLAREVEELTGGRA